QGGARQAAAECAVEGLEPVGDPASGPDRAWREPTDECPKRCDGVACSNRRLARRAGLGMGTIDPCDGRLIRAGGIGSGHREGRIIREINPLPVHETGSSRSVSIYVPDMF
ncbi:MAG: hypothetical protein WD715_16600, partial [Dongiaceae bacterium]